MRKVNYKEKGITLIALVITIIILLILAGVTLTTALSQNGLFERAKYAGEKYKESEADEAEKLGEVEEEIDKMIDGEDPPSGGIGSSEIAENLKQYQGKYVDIGLDVDGDEDTTNDWEIFYAGNGRIFLISADYVPTTKLEAWNVIGDNTTLGSSGFKKYYDRKYSVCWEFDSKLFLDLPTEPNKFSELVMHNKYDLEKNKNNYNSVAVSHLLNKDSWKGIKEAAKEKDNIDFVIGGSTLEMWCAAWNEAVAEDTNGFVGITPALGTSGYGYNVSSSEMSDKDSLFMNGSTEAVTSEQLNTLSKTYKTFFPHTGVSGWNNCYGYWLASPSDFHSDLLVDVGVNGCVNHNSWDNGMGVRPVVSLRSGVQILGKENARNIYDLGIVVGMERIACC